MKKVLSFIVCLIFSIFGVVLVLSEIEGDFNITKFIAVKVIGFLFIWAAMRIYKWAKLD